MDTSRKALNRTASYGLAGCSKSGLDGLTSLSRRFGGPDFVLGGGGNSSFKDENVLWIKPSGVSLRSAQPDMFIAMKRDGISELYASRITGAKREQKVKNMLEAAKVSAGESRPSVETPLHHLIDNKYIVHTHPALVNGLACSKNGKDVCEKLFPQALWLSYVDPGYTLCLHAERGILRYKKMRRKDPSIILLQNHGVFVSGNTKEEVISAYDNLITRLVAEYKRRGMDLSLRRGQSASKETIDVYSRLIKLSFPEKGLEVVYAAPADLCENPVIPDHIVYGKARFCKGVPDRNGFKDFEKQNGYWPRIINTDIGVFGIGSGLKHAQLAVEVALEGALIKQLAAAFGGPHYLSDRAVDFIVNWEAESYRYKIAGG